MKYKKKPVVISVITSLKVPFHTICGCSTCGCTMGNNMVYQTSGSISVGTSTTTHITSLSPKSQSNGVSCEYIGYRIA